MSYDSQKVISGRKPFTVIILYRTICSNIYGVAPCTASGAAGSECRNTRATCQDVPNFNKTTDTVKLCDNLSNIPPGEGLIPCVIKQPLFTSTRINPGEGIGPRGKVKVTCADFQWTDTDLDPYFSTRTFNQKTTGSFWPRFKAANKYYIGWKMEVKTGYIGSPFSWDDFKTRTYFVEKIEGPNKSGQVQIEGKDILKALDDNRAKIPEVSAGVLAANVSSGATSLSLSPGTGASYSTAGTGIIGDEFFSWTGKGTDTLTGLTWELYNSDPDDHEVDDLVQECEVVINENVCDLLYRYCNLFIDGETYIPYDAGHAIPTGTPLLWDNERTNWLETLNLDGVIAKPTGIKEIIKNIGASCNLDIFWDPASAELRLKANMPPPLNATIDTLTDDLHFVSDSVMKKDRPDLWASQVWVWFNTVNPAGDQKSDNFRDLEISAADQTNKNEIEQIKSIFSRFFDASNRSNAAALAGRLLGRYQEIPTEFTFELDAKDDNYEPGDLINIDTCIHQDQNGNNLIEQTQIIEVQEVVPGHRYRYKSLTSTFSNRYWYIGPNTLIDYSLESDENRLKYGFICNNSALFDDGSPANRII